jgi:predicted aminopeptidase
MNRIILLLVISMLLGGCDLPYYWQAAHGQWDLIQRQQPISELLQSEELSADKHSALQYVLEARQFALQQLPLEDNKSYLDYVDIERPYVTWNVFATPALSMQNHTWCYPIAGCVSYRGYFKQQDALSFAANMTEQGYDTYVGGVGAYSTLGWFDDPVLSTFLERDQLSLAALLFHELAHQVLYVKNDTVFNESFATSVERILLHRWIEQRQLQGLWEPFLAAEKRQEQFSRLVIENKQERQRLFESNQTEQQKRLGKQRLIKEFHQQYEEFKHHWNGFNGYDQWVNQGLNNAQLSTVATYHELTPAFEALFKKHEQNLGVFLQQCQHLATLEKTDRHQRLNQLVSPNIVYTQN